jgi:NodT family efflux transporter outer membrane factor (OMF) lipoprotein
VALQLNAIVDRRDRTRTIALSRTAKGRARDAFFATLSLIAIVLGAAACNVGPDYVRPKVTVNTQWSEQRDRRLANSAVAIEWWRSFDDPTLDWLIEVAYRQNLTLQIAALRIFEARAEVGVAIGEQLPENPGPIGTGSVQKLSKHAPNSARIDRFYGDYQIGFDAVWEVDLWGKYRRGVRAARAGYLATVADYDAAIVSLTAEVARTYVLIRTFEALIELARQNADIQEEAQRIAESRFRNGATSELDVAQATNLLETTRASIPKLQVDLRHAQNALSTLLGRPTGFVRSRLTETSVIPTPPAQVAISVPAKMLRRRPDIRGAELRAAAQCERIGIAKADLFPSFVLFGSIGTQTSSGGGVPSGNSSIGDLFGPGSLVGNAGGSVFWPILRYPKILSNMRVEDARFQQAIVEYRQTVLQAAQEVEDGIIGFLRQQDAAVFARSAVNAAELSVELALVQYREGAVDFQRVIDTQRVLLASQNELLDTRSAVATSLIALYKALGGGWEIRRGRPIVDERNRREMEERIDWGSHLSEPKEKKPPKKDASAPTRKSSRR